MSLARKGSAEWLGTGLEGNGSLNTPSGLLNNTPYSLSNRFKNKDGKAGTNPEELIAAAHAGCFCMALSFHLVGAGYNPVRRATEVTINLKQEGYDWSFSSIELVLEATFEGIGEEKFVEIANQAKKTCPVSMALSAIPIHLKANLT